MRPPARHRTSAQRRVGSVARGGWARRIAIALALAAGLARPGEARAWDPSTTHLGMLERSALDSAIHLRWMEASLLRRGLFTPLRLDPTKLPESTLRTLRLALRDVHAASGAQALGGPGACPGAGSPEATRARCVEGDLWETTALGWLELGVVVETVPAERLLHHFVDRTDPAAAQWSDDDLPRSVLRNKHAEAGGTLAARATGGAFEGSGRSALTWLDDASDPWAPPALVEHLRRASLAATPAERDHHLALALLCTGALLHVMQDLSVPAHARGDVTAMFLPLSEIPGDRGLPLQELARDSYGRGGLPTPVPLSPRPADVVLRGTPRAPSLRAHVLGHESYPGLVQEAGRKFFSESSLPPARRVATKLDPQAAAAVVLEGATLDPSEREGAVLEGWPAQAGYLLGGSGRPLAAFRVDEDDQVHLWLDRRVYRVQMQQLIPIGVDAGRSVLDLVYAAWPTMTVDRAGRSVTLVPGATWKDATLRVLVEDDHGMRSLRAETKLEGEAAHRVVDVWPADLPERSRVVLVLQNPAGVLPAVVEQIVDPREAPKTGKAGGTPAVPRPRAQPPTTRKTDAAPPVRATGETPAEPGTPVEPETTEEPEASESETPAKTGAPAKPGSPKTDAPGKPGSPPKKTAAPEDAAAAPKGDEP